MNNPVFIKSFSKGQITIPKKIRESVGLSSDFWLKVSIDNGKIIAEPIEEKGNKNKQEWKKSLLKMKQIYIDLKEIKRNREEIENILRQQSLWKKFFCKKAGRIKAHDQDISLIDAIIAATAIEHSLFLSTLNLKDFEEVKDLKILN